MKNERKPLTAREVQPTWEFLVSTEQTLNRAILASRILKPVGMVLFGLGILIGSVNLLLGVFGETLMTYLKLLPLLPSLIGALPHSGLAQSILLLVLLGFGLPLLVNGILYTVIYLVDRSRVQRGHHRLLGTEIECARALTYQAEAVYEQRKKLRSGSVYPIAVVLTAILAYPVCVTLYRLMTEAGGSVLMEALALLALLFVLFVLFWFYAMSYKGFCLLNSLFWRAPSEWTLYMTYQRADAYWESIDPQEFARRQAEAARTGKKSKAAKRAAQGDEDYDEPEALPEEQNDSYVPDFTPNDGYDPDDFAAPDNGYAADGFSAPENDFSMDVVGAPEAPRPSADDPSGSNFPEDYASGDAPLDGYSPEDHAASAGNDAASTGFTLTFDDAANNTPENPEQ